MDLGIGAQTFDCDEENYTWIEMELANKAKISDFKRITEYSFDFIQNFISYIKSWYSRRHTFFNTEYKEQFKEICEDPYDYGDIFGELIDYLTNYQLESVGDLQRISSWGIVKRNGKEKLVLIDYGVSDEIMNDYY